MSDSGESPFDPTKSTGEHNPFGENPYLPPQATYADAARLQRGMVGQVTVLAVLMIVQGVLEILMGLMLAGMAVFMPIMIQMESSGARANGPPEEMAWLFGGIYGTLGLLTLIAAVLHILGGLGAYRFRRRRLGLVAFCFGMVTIFTCYCAPTAVALGIYGLIVYLNAPVAQAFAMGDDGRSRDEILAHFHAW